MSAKLSSRPRAATVLVVEDDDATRNAVGSILEDDGYEVITAADPASGLAAFRERSPDLAILDLMFKRGRDDRDADDGLLLCSDMKDLRDVPIILYSASRNPVVPRLGLKLGAADFIKKPDKSAGHKPDDYIEKPFEIEYLLARVEALLGDHKRKGEGQVRVGALTIDTEARLVEIEGRMLELPPIEYNLLRALGTNPGKAVSREDLSNAGWADFDHRKQALDTQMMRLRQRLAKSSPHAPRIVTVRGSGYKLT